MLQVSSNRGDDVGLEVVHPYTSFLKIGIPILRSLNRRLNLLTHPTCCYMYMCVQSYASPQNSPVFFHQSRVRSESLPHVLAPSSLELFSTPTLIFFFFSCPIG